MIVKWVYYQSLVFYILYAETFKKQIIFKYLHNSRGEGAVSTKIVDS